ncbi:AMP-dependent synthetase/ligase [Gallibacterium salpingitidis]|uniref:Long-chain fatty acid--CoA ligase n=1 Tax=Gallibacterium salpingitidis TaxID=505341 RepID=A0A1A7NXD1_9PAST|nr:long-chain fatty acid--CoA ligase [Gallibacterium salpingitidis]OBW94847.1 long-chain fatty acid--CoA ligase [Gallibacterium salpingitidis]
MQNPSQQLIHFIDVIHQQSTKLSQHTALRYFAENGELRDISWQQFRQQIDQLSLALLTLGLQPQDKVGIFAQNMAEWTIADVAILQIRAVTVPIFATNNAIQTEYIVNHSDMKVLFVGDQKEYDTALSIVERCPQLEKIVAMQPLDLRGAEIGITWQDFLLSADSAMQSVLQQRITDKSMSDLFTLIYTSGTTGEPKGVMLDYQNLAHQLATHKQTLMKIDHQDVSLSFLPLSHIFERAWVAYVLSQGAVNVYLSDPHQVKEAIVKVKPTLMCSVPRFYEKIYAAVQDKVAHAPWLRRQIFHSALRIGKWALHYKQQQQPLPIWLKPLYQFADKAVFSKLRNLLGGRIRMMPCGGAKLEPQIGRFFHVIGVNIKLGYGMTETTATVSCWQDFGFDSNSIGHIMTGTTVKIGAENEILVKGGGVMKGYYKNPEETAKSFTEDGFLKTGDAGYVDEHGNLFMTDRIKELMKTSTGKYIAPQLVEGKFLQDKLIEQIAVIADARKYVSALVVPCFDTLEEYAKRLNIKYQNRLELIKNATIVEMFEKRINELQKELQGFEKIKKFTLLPQAFSTELGEITPTLKLRRKVILERYRHLIEKMYQ